MSTRTSPRGHLLRTGAVIAIPSLLMAGLIALTPVAAVAATPDPATPPGSDIYHVSQAASGTTSQVYLAPGGQQAAFVSTDADLVPGDGNGVADVFLSTARPGTEDVVFTAQPELISVPDGPVGATRANADSSSPVMSADGRWVAFTSMATNLVSPASPTEMSNIYVRDTLNDTTIRLQAPGAMPDGPSYDPDISDDGRYVVFTSDATNLSPNDINGAADAYFADLDANGDGIRGDVALTRFVQDANITDGTKQAVISGNGRWVAFVAGTDNFFFYPSATTGEYLYRGEVRTLIHDAEKIADNATEPAIDANGSTIAYVQTGACDEPASRTIVGVSVDVAGGTPFVISLGTTESDIRSGDVWDPQISNDGSTITWTTTVPKFDFTNGGVPSPPLPRPVIRVQQPNWWDSNRDAIECSLSLTPDWWDIALGEGSSLSASGRTFAWTAEDFTYVVDTNSNNGLSVTTTQGELSTPDFFASALIADIPLSNLRGYAGTLANAPIHQLPIHQLPIHQLPIHQLPIHQLLIDDSPIHQLPIHQLPIHQLPIHQLPIHQLDLPGGWAQLLEGTKFAGDLIQTVTLAEVLAWADEIMASCPPLTDGVPESTDCAAARRIQSLTLGDVGLDGSGLDALSLASYVLGNAPLSELRIGGDGEPLARWQALADGQGLEVDIDVDLNIRPPVVLAELDAAGLDVSRAGLEEIDVTAPDFPLEKTLFRYLLVQDLFLTSTPLGELSVTSLTDSARIDLFGTTAVTGTLAQPDPVLLEDANLEQLVAGLTTEVTFGTLLFSLLDRANFPWEEIDPISLDRTDPSSRSYTSECPANDRCRSSADFRVTFDAGPGEVTTFPVPTVSITLPDGTQSTQLFVGGSGPDAVWSDFNQYTGPVVRDGGLVRVPLADTASGTALTLGAWFSATARPGNSYAEATVVSGELSASTAIGQVATLGELDDPRNNIESMGPDGLQMLREGKIFYEWLSPSWLQNDDETGLPIQSPVADDADYYQVDAPPPGKRLVISTNAKDGQIALALYSRSGASAAGLGTANAGAAPGTAVNEQSGIDGQPAESGADAGVALPGQTLVDQAVMGGGGTAEVEAASSDTETGERLTVRVTSGNGAPSSSLYSLRARYVDEPAESACPAFVPVQPVAEGVVGTSDAVTADTDTIYLFDQQRYGLRYGATAAAEVRAALETLSEPTLAGAGAVNGAVLSIDTDAGVQGARVDADQNPCSMSERRALTSAINTYVGAAIAGHRDHITSVVIVGGDDMIPFAPVGQHTADFTEQSHAGDLRLKEVSPGVPCPPLDAAGDVDPCATPLSAAASGGFILTDDPYGLPDTYESLGGYLYVPTVALGRLVETSDQIQATITSYLDADGTLDVDSSATGGYGAWSELPAIVNEQLNWRIPAAQQHPLTGEWLAADLNSAIFGGAESPRVVSINTHADETRLLPAIPDAEAGKFTDDDLFKAGAPSQAQLASLDGALVFLIGCHAGNNLPGAYYGDATDWVDVFSHAGGYVGNTGYGLANNVTTALSERLLGLYADWIGTAVGDTQVSASAALTYAKQSYLGGVGLYSGYDEKILMEAVYYGLPMYSIGGPSQAAPLPARPTNLQAITTPVDGLATASLSFTPSFGDPTSVTLPDGRIVQYLTAAPQQGAAAQQPVAVAGQPVLPKIVSKLDAAPSGLEARGVLLTSLTSEIETAIDVPAIAEPNVGVPQTEAVRAGAAFPSSYAAVSRQDTPSGPIDLLVVTPASVTIGQKGKGQAEKFTEMGLKVLYGPTTPMGDDTAVDEIPPIVKTIELPGVGGGRMFIQADGTGSPVTQMVLLIQPEGNTNWVPIPVTESGRYWIATIPTAGPYRWMLQLVDAYGNVTTETQRGHLDEASAPAPTLGDPGGAASIHPDDRVVRTVSVGQVALGDRLTGKVIVTDSDGNTVATGDAVVKTAVDGSTTASFDQAFPNIGAYTLALQVCRGTECSQVSFPVDVTPANSLPTATVSIESDSATIDPSATLTASAVGADADEDDVVVVSYSWSRNGIATGVTGPTLELADISAQAGDVIEVAAAPSDGKATGHLAYAQVTVEAEPAAPTITVSATNALGEYTGAPAWSRSAVTVVFDCTGDGITCPASQLVATDTGTDGVPVEGSVTDSRGRTVEASMLVLVDATLPRISATATPSSVPVGGLVTVTVSATDDGSGLAAAASCGTPDTTTVGTKTVTCTATDRAGNAASATASYTVTPAGPPPCGTVPDRTALPPLNADGSSVFPRTSGVPVIFRACDASGNPIGTKALAKKVTLVSTTNLPPQATVNELKYQTTKTFAYDKQTGLWTGYILTANLAAGKKYVYRIDLADGTSFTVTFGVR